MSDIETLEEETTAEEEEEVVITQNTIEAFTIENPEEIMAECSRFTIVDITLPFTLRNIMTVGTQYTFSLWLRSDIEENGNVLVRGDTLPATTSWGEYVHTFVATGTDLKLYFDTPGVYYIYHPQLERGNRNTDWSLAPEEVDEAISDAQNTADNAIAGVEEVQLIIDEIQNTIQFLVQGLNEGSMMTQTEDGWVLTTGSTKEELQKLSELLNELNAAHDSTSSAVKELKTAIGANEKLASYIRIDDTGVQPLIEMGVAIDGELGNLKLRITNTAIRFMDGDNELAWISNQQLHIPKAVIEEEMIVGGFVLKQHGTRNNVGYLWKGVTS